MAPSGSTPAPSPRQRPRRRSIVQILGLGLAALIGVFAAAALSAALRTRALARDTEELTGRVARARTAAFELEINAEELASATRELLATDHPGSLARVADAKRDLLRFRQLLTQTGVVPGSDRLLSAPVDQFMVTADSLAAYQQRKSELLGRVRAGLAGMDSLLDDEIQAAAERALPGRPGAYQAAEEMEINLVELAAGLWDFLASHDPRTREEIGNDREDFERFLTRYRAIATTPREARWGAELDARYREHVRLVDQALRVDGQLQAWQHDFSLLEARLDDLLDHQVQPQVEAHRSATASRARTATRNAAVWAIAGLVLAGLVGGAVAAAALRAVSRPLAQLSAAANRIGAGDFSRPVGRLPTAEFDHLAVSFDRMSAELAGTRSQLEAARDEAEEASRRKSEFVSEVAHELRTPLTAIRASLGLLAASAGASLPPAAARLVELAKRNSERLGNLIDDTLDLDRIEAGADDLHPVPVAASSLVGAALDATRARAEERGVLLEELSDETRVRGDPRRLERVLINLISNAVKYAPAGSVVQVRAAPLGEDCRFEVADCGPGIPEAHQPRIFQRFARAGGEKDPGGTGLGLALARAIVERHGGVIGFESRPGCTRFWFTVPLAAERPAAASPEDLVSAGERDG